MAILIFLRNNILTGNEQLDKLIEEWTQYDASRRPTAAEALEIITTLKF